MTIPATGCPQPTFVLDLKEKTRACRLQVNPRYQIGPLGTQVDSSVRVSFVAVKTTRLFAPATAVDPGPEVAWQLSALSCFSRYTSIDTSTVL